MPVAVVDCGGGRKLMKKGIEENMETKSKVAIHSKLHFSDVLLLSGIKYIPLSIITNLD